MAGKFDLFQMLWGRGLDFIREDQVWWKLRKVKPERFRGRFVKGALRAGAEKDRIARGNDEEIYKSLLLA